MAAWSCRERAEGLENLLYRFFQALVNWDGSEPIALTAAGREYKGRRDWLPVITSVEPYQNSARNVTRSTAKVLQQEFARAAAISAQAIAGEDSWESLFAPADFWQEWNLCLEIETSCEDAVLLAEASSYLEGRSVGLTMELEKQLGAMARPWPQIWERDRSVRAIWGLELPPRSDLELLREVVEGFLGQLPDSCDWQYSIGDRDS